MNPERLTLIFTALSDPTRRAIIDRLASGEATAGELAEPFGISKPAVSKHLRILEKANLISRRKEAQWHRFSLKSESLKMASDWISTYREFWDHRLDELSEFLHKNRQGEKS